MKLHVRIRVYVPFLSLVSASLAVGLLSGCSGSFAPSAVEPSETPIGNIQGTVHGGQAPVTGAQIYLFAASTAAYGHISTSLITSGKTGVTCNTTGTLNGDCYVTTDSNGNFALGGDYTCTQGTQVYMVAVGGNPGQSVGAPFSTTATFGNRSNTITVTSATGIAIGQVVSGTGIATGTTVTNVAGTTISITPNTTARENGGVTVTFTTPAVNNTAIVQMAGLAQCPSAGNLAAQVPYLVINEVTTVTFAYAMSGFGTDAFHISSDATGATALANAMANANNIVNIQYGQAPAVTNGNKNSINPQAKLYALANIVATCVNTASASAGSCTSLFNLAKNGTTTPTDESTALFNIAHNQAANVANIWKLYLGNAIFSPTLTTQPTDWTMPVIYTGLVSPPGTTNNQITSGPFNIAFDASGNAWIGDRVKGVVEIGPQGASQTFSKNFGMVKGVAVSPVDGTIWVSDYANNVVDIMDTTGTILTVLNSTTLNDNDLNGPIFTSFSGNAAGQAYAYQANETSTGVLLFDAAAYTEQDFENVSNFPDIQTPGWITVDNNGMAWMPSTSTNFVGQATASEKGKSGKFTYSSAEVRGPLSAYSMAADSNGNLWFGSNTGNGDLEEIPSGKTVATDIGNGGGANGAYKVAIDGNNTIWIANANANTVSAYNGGWLATNGFSTSAPDTVRGSAAGCVVAAPDPSGNLWTANADGSVTQLLGLATPTAAPFYGGVNTTANGGQGNLGTEP